jgi:hypothetical protein
MESPAAADTVTPASTRYLRKFTGKSRDGQDCRGCPILSRRFARRWGF